MDGKNADINDPTFGQSDHNLTDHLSLTDNFTMIQHLTDTLKLHNNGLLYSNTAIRWAVTFGTARRGLSKLQPCLVPSPLYQM